MRVADYIVERLAEIGVGHVFMVTGRGILFLTDAVAKNENIEGVSLHHEQSCSYAAVSYAQQSESFGACLVSTGCGATNAITGLLTAWQDGVPCIFISGQNMLNETTRFSKIPMRTFGNQEADIIELVEPITKYASMVTCADTIGYELDKALFEATDGHQGPVWLDIPLDIQNTHIKPDELERFTAEKSAYPQSIDNDVVQTIAKELSQASRPVLMLGSGVRSALAQSELNALIQKINIPVVYDCAAVDIYPSENELSIGAVGSLGGNRAGNFAIQNSDYVLVLGCRLSPLTTGDEYDKFVREGKVVVVDIDEVEHRKETVKIDLFVHGDAKAFLDKLNDQQIDEVNTEWVAKAKHWKQVFPKCEDKYKQSELVDSYYLAETLGHGLKDNTIVTTDAGMAELIFPSGIGLRNGQRFIHPASQGAMGAALPLSIGAQIQSGNEVVSVNGDGSIMMNLQELQTISHLNLPVKVFVINNNCYAVINKRQKDLFRRRTIGTNQDDGVSCPDFKKVADAFDLPYVKIENSEDLQNKVNQVLNLSGPVLCEVMGLEGQEYIKNDLGRNAKRRFVRRGLEDQAPFMDRDLFLKEMIVTPIDQ
ncbi:thiamine pyrophosphate-binding protein [Vibrio tapetis subsp. quintayensis]|uniref:thiamine pyrophosphate-binding protein n=1 Tax=Vibrio tapetis TaxID=52443 RepID=UPI0025B2AFB5|nr:thiamine pyrophosphate-binding protein [Vibrio tapetis]MDN3679461.1 thiamine pyrophosphate-binding protein [Vibrio tapetis subsp. quintayensis]